MISFDRYAHINEILKSVYSFASPVQIGIVTLESGYLEYQVVWRGCRNADGTYNCYTYGHHHHADAVQKMNQMLKNREYL